MDSYERLEHFPAEQLRAKRNALGVSQRHLAETSGVPQSVISALERGGDGRWSTWKRLFDSLGFTAVLMPEGTDDVEDLYNDGIQRRKDRMENGRAARWG